MIKLYQDGAHIREIARLAHLSFGSIGKIIRIIKSHDDNDTNSNNFSNKSKATRALYLFSNGMTPIDVAIKLDLSALEVENLQKEY